MRLKGELLCFSILQCRGYKNGYVWQDLSENDLIKPTDGIDYILKGSEMLQSAVNFRSLRGNLQNGSDDINKTRRKKHQSWSSFENSTDYQNEYRVYKCESSRELGGKSADMATQTEEKDGRSRSLKESYRSKAVELSREDLSPPPSMSSSEGPDGTSGSGDIDRTTEADRAAASRTGKASRVLIHLMTCGSKLSQIHEVVHV